MIEDINENIEEEHKPTFEEIRAIVDKKRPTNKKKNKRLPLRYFSHVPAFKATLLK